jgi:hypothetical protein
MKIYIAHVGPGGEVRGKNKLVELYIRTHRLFSFYFLVDDCGFKMMDVFQAIIRKGGTNGKDQPE